MNYWLLCFFLIFLLHIAVYAAHGQRRDAVTVEVIFEPVQTIVLNPGHKTVRALYNTTPIHRHRVETVQQEQLTAFSTSAFEVSVRATEKYVFDENGDEVMEVSELDADALSPDPDYHDPHRTASRAITTRSQRSVAVSTTELVYTLTTK